jgi:hypothetical protein
MSKIITVNQLIEEFKRFSDAHFQLKDFGYGPTSDIGKSRSMSFPYLWVTHRTPSTISVQNKTQIPEMALTFVIVDQLNYQENYLAANGLDSDNQQEVISDCFQIAQDLVNYISQNLGARGIKIMDEAFTIEPTFDDTDDRVSGWVLDLNLKLIHFNCVTPMADVIYPSGSTVPIPVIPSPFVTCETLKNCDIIQASNKRLYTQTGDGTEIVNTAVQGSLIGPGLGTLTVPANTFQPGGSFRVVLGGVMSNQNNVEIRIQIRSNGLVLSDSDYRTMVQHTDDVFKIEQDFTIRTIGGPGTASVLTLGTLHTSKKNSGAVTGFGWETLEATTFDTTVDQTLDITAQWRTSHPNNSIQSQIFTLTQTY